MVMLRRSVHLTTLFPWASVTIVVDSSLIVIHGSVYGPCFVMHHFVFIILTRKRVLVALP